MRQELGSLEASGAAIRRLNRRPQPPPFPVDQAFLPPNKRPHPLPVLDGEVHRHHRCASSLLQASSSARRTLVRPRCCSHVATDCARTSLRPVALPGQTLPPGCLPPLALRLRRSVGVLAAAVPIQFADWRIASQGLELGWASELDAS